MIKRNELPSRDILFKFLSFDFEKGKIFWMPRKAEDFPFGGRNTQEQSCKSFNTRFAGKEAMRDTRGGYFSGTFRGVAYMSHRILFKAFHDAEPIEIDHIDGNRKNNAISNLVASDRSKNMRNISLRKDNKNGVTGVYWYPNKNKWVATIGENGIKRCLGYHIDFEEAVKARKEAEREMGYSSTHGRLKPDA